MKNIFENAYFGKAYKTRDGRKAIYYKKRNLVKGWHWILVDGEGMYQLNDNGLLCECEETRFDIIDEWTIDEGKLDDLANEYFYSLERDNGIRSHFKAGYRKAKEA